MAASSARSRSASRRRSSSSRAFSASCRRFDERDRLGVERFATLGENFDRLGERAPARQQEFGATAFLAPLRLGRLDPRPRAQELAVGFDQRGGARPAGDERLMGQADPRPVGDQQPRRDERLEQTGAAPAA